MVRVFKTQVFGSFLGLIFILGVPIDCHAQLGIPDLDIVRPLETFSVFDSITNDDPFDNSFFIEEVPIGNVPRYNPLDGSLTEVGVSAMVDFDYDVFMDTNGILSMNTHTADAEGIIEVGLGIVSNDGTSLTAISSIGIPWATGCIGVPTDMDGCQGFDGGGGTLDLSGTISGEDLNDLIGEGDSASLVVFVARPTSAEFNLNNVGGAGIEISTSVNGGSASMGYFANEGDSADSPLLPPPLSALPISFDNTDCEGRLCLVGNVGNSGLGRDMPLFFDPPVSVGFDYAVVEGPTFAGIEIPPGFGDLFELLVSVDDGDTYQSFGVIEDDVLHDLTVAFPGGVSHLRLLGIDPAEGLDPDDPTAFPTGLTFTGPGVVGITMTPIVVPEPRFDVLIALMLGLTAMRLRK